MLLYDQANLECQLSDELLIISREKDSQEIFDDGWTVVRCGYDIQQVQSHDPYEDVVLIKALEDGVSMRLDNPKIILGHEIQVEQGKILGICILDRDELSQDVGHHFPQLRTRLEQHEALEALEENGIGSVL